MLDEGEGDRSFSLLKQSPLLPVECIEDKLFKCSQLSLYLPCRFDLY